MASRGSAAADDAVAVAVAVAGGGGPLVARTRGPAAPRALEQELGALLGSLRRERGETGPRRSNMLFAIWNKYEHKISTELFRNKLLSTGDILVELKNHKMALNLCYGRYLQYIYPSPHDIGNLSELMARFFPRELGDSDCVPTVRALLGFCTCQFALLVAGGGGGEMKRRCLQLLFLLRLLTQALLQDEQLCWLLYNGTVHIYTISRHLMEHGHSAKVCEYLLWASVCMESSVPLLDVRYLSWRATLYTAVCQAYYDCKLPAQAEEFARRGLAKIAELSELESQSSSPHSNQAESAFRDATIKMAIMIFKHTVFESRKKPKGFLRTRMKTNLRDPKIAQAAWPRTGTERLLSELLEGGAAQMVAVLDALSHRAAEECAPHALAGSPAAAFDHDSAEVSAELFFAGAEIIAGGGGNSERRGAILSSNVLAGIRDGQSLMELAVAGEDGVTEEATVRFLKLAFLCERWDIFEGLISPTLGYLQTKGTTGRGELHQTLELLQTLEPLLSGRRTKHAGLTSAMDSSMDEQTFANGARPKTAWSLDELLTAVEKLNAATESLHATADLTSKAVQEERSLLTDASAQLWHGCKAALSRVQMRGANDSARHRVKTDSLTKLCRALCSLHGTMCVLGVAQKDLLALVEASLRLSALLQSSAEQTLRHASAQASSEADRSASSQRSLQTDMVTSYREQLWLAFVALSRALDEVGVARGLTRPRGGSAITSMDPSRGDAEGCEPGMESSTRTALEEDLHLEMLWERHRVALKLLHMQQPTSKADGGQLKKPGRSCRECIPKQPGTDSSLTEEDVLATVGRNPLSKAAFIMQKALLEASAPAKAPSEVAKMLEGAAGLIRKAEMEKSGFHLPGRGTPRGQGAVPPPPLLLRCGERGAVFTPVPFSGSPQVVWYRLLGRTAAGHNVKVRLSDYHLQATGEEVLAGEGCLLRAEGLQPNEKYVFAVAAYARDGSLVGGTIGETTRPILASCPLPTLLAWAYLAQVAFQTRCFTIARSACTLLWDHFVSSPESESDSEDSVKRWRLREEAVSGASPILLRLFVSSVFISCDVTMGGASVSSEKRVPLQWQSARLEECARVLVALELCHHHLDEPALTLQAGATCHGLLAPFMYHGVTSRAAAKVLWLCLDMIKAVPASVRVRKQAGFSESLQHMVAKMSNYLAKAHCEWNEPDIAGDALELGKRLLREDLDGLALPSSLEMPRATDRQDVGSSTLLESSIGKRLTIKKQLAPKEERNFTAELNALEAFALKISKQDVKADLTGLEDPMVLHSCIAKLPLKMAHKEVMKFHRHPRFLEFFVHLLNRALSEDAVELAVEWGEDIQVWLIRRNELILGLKPELEKMTGLIRVGTDDPRKQASIIADYHKSLEPQLTSRSTVAPKRSVPGKLSRQRESKKQHEKKALEQLTGALTSFVRPLIHRQRLRQVCTKECLWRSRFNQLLGWCHLTLFLRKCEWVQRHNKPGLWSDAAVDSNIFSLEASGVVVAMPEVPATARDGAKETEVTRAVTAQKSASSQRRVLAMMKVAGSNGGSDDEHDDDDDDDDDDCDGGGDGSGRSGSSSADSSHGEARSKRTRRSAGKDDDPGASLVELTERLTAACTHLRRAVVLAHRGGHRSLLWDVSRSLLDCVRSSHESQRLEEDDGGGGGGACHVPARTQREVVWFPLFLAADSMLDRVTRTQGRPKDNTVDEEQDYDDDDGDGLEGGDAERTAMMDLRSLVLRALETLHRQCKWEHLAHLALRFNDLTRNRHAEQVTPLLVHAQWRLLERVRDSGGPEPPQPHLLLLAEQQGGQKSTSHNFVGEQPIVATMSRDSIEPGMLIDPAGRNLYAGGLRARQLACVPLHVDDTLRRFRESLSRRPYAHRALAHCRRLLALFLASALGGGAVADRRGEGRTSVRASGLTVAFRLPATHSHDPSPPDLASRDFSSAEDVEWPPLPRAQINIVISAYTKTVELLESDKQQRLRAHALHELGNLHYHSGNTRAAFTCWSQALDASLGISDCLGSWSDAVARAAGKEASGDASSALLRLGGVRGCLLAAVLASKIAQFILTADFAVRIRCSVLASMLFKAIFRASLPHPKADVDYARYEVDGGQGSPVPGVEPLTPSPTPGGGSLDVGTIVSCLSFLARHLHRAGLLLPVLPLLALYQHLVCSICRDVQRSVEGRLLKVNVLTDLALFGDASREMCTVLLGEKLPLPVFPGFKAIDSKPVAAAAVVVVASMQLDTSKAILTDGNLQAVELLLTQPLSPALESALGPRLCYRVSLTRARLLVRLAAALGGLPPPRAALYGLFTPPRETGSESDLSSDSSSQLSARTRPSSRGSAARDEELVWQLVAHKDQLTPEVVKGILLLEAEAVLGSVDRALVAARHGIGDRRSLRPSQLEEAVLVHLEAARVALERHWAPVSAARAISAMKLLQEARALGAETAIEVGGWRLRDQERDVEARGRLDLRLWLECRLMVATALTQWQPDPAAGLGDADARRFCKEGLAESEACGDVETQAEFMSLSALLDFHECRPIAGIRSTLQAILELLDRPAEMLSQRAHLLLAEVTARLADLACAVDEGPETELRQQDHAVEKDDNDLPKLSAPDGGSLPFMAESLSLCLKAEQIVLSQVRELGFVGDISNSYLPHVNMLAKIKLRIGCFQAVESSQALAPQGGDGSEWLRALHTLDSALRLCHSASTQDRDLAAEILLQRGNVECRIALGGHCDPRTAVRTLLKSVDVSQGASHQLWIMKQAYLEAALLFCRLSEKTRASEAHTEQDAVAEKGKTDPAKQPNKSKVVVRGRSQALAERGLSVSERYSLLAWIATRAATQVGECCLAWGRLLSDQSGDVLGREVALHLPEFMLLDLVASHSLAAPDAAEPTLGFRDETVSRCRSRAATLTWAQVLRYRGAIVRRTDLASQLDYFPGRRRAAIGGCLVRSPLNLGSCRLFLRAGAVHRFLAERLAAYAAGPCRAPPAPQQLLHTPPHAPSAASQELADALAKADSLTGLVMMQPLTPPTVQGGEGASETDPAFGAKSNELCLQWHQPLLEPLRPTKEVMLFTASNTRPFRVIDVRTCGAADASCTCRPVLLSRLHALSPRLASLRSQGSLLAADEPSSSPHPPALPLPVPPGHGSTVGERQKPAAARLKAAAGADGANLGTVKLQDLARECAAEIQRLLGSHADSEPLSEMPFDLSHNALRSLEATFSTASGFRVTEGRLHDWLGKLLSQMPNGLRQ
ncbi:LOW QUALITY PROTEIN: cilia- and flagella-associated protein 54 [Lethenteron reissneri]|uniref:LOW QUALITY PROTEIN: cilia- and flagella-associated protein 54 n=1 Tax=Lethenteron reissneri TaxID=7753 RepID=UPI002AB64970|nr:LOW QUALITY PROTEIN: cilia- and flagella-associated protein 54 [Lethenteron reissneri]